MKLLQFFGAHMISTGTLHRRANGSVDDEGDWVPGAESTSVLTLVIPQPVSADEIEMDNDGESIKDYKQTWVDSDVEVRTRTDTADADHITVSDIEYKVHQINDWSLEGGFLNIVLRRV